MALKLYACTNFPPIAPTSCPYSVTDEESLAVDKGTDHLAHEHGLEDTPQLRTDVKSCLVDPPPGG